MSRLTIEEETKGLLALAGQTEEEKKEDKMEHHLDPVAVLDEAVAKAEEDDSNRLAYAKKVEDSRIQDIKRQGQFKLSDEGRCLTFEDNALKLAGGDRSKLKKFYEKEDINKMMDGLPQACCQISG